MRVLLVLVLVWLTLADAFLKPAASYRSNFIVPSTEKESATKLQLFLAPQIGFAAACAGAVFAYVYSNIDSIKEVRIYDVDVIIIFTRNAMPEPFAITQIRYRR